MKDVGVMNAGDTYECVDNCARPPTVETVEIIRHTAATLWWKYRGSERVWMCRRNVATYYMPKPAEEQVIVATRARARAYQLVQLIEPAVKAADLATLEAVWAVFEGRKAKS